MLLATFQKENEDMKGALSTLETLYEKNPYDLWLINELVMEYADQNLKVEEALNMIDSVLKYQPRNSIFIDTKGWILLKMNKTEEAKKLFQKSIDLNPNNKDAKKHYNML